MPATMVAPATIRARKAVMWTREDCRAMEKAGLLPERWELIDGEIISKMGTKLPHAGVCQELQLWLSSVFTRGHVTAAASLDVAPEDNPTNEPEADILVLDRPWRQLEAYALPGMVQLLVEVSDTTLDHDLGPKAGLYARAGIQEYWVVDVRGRAIHQHREPTKTGYASVQVIAAGQRLSPLAQPGAELDPAVLFA